MALALAILQAFAAIPKVGSLISKVIAAYLSWLDVKELERIQLGAHMLRTAKTPEEKRKALDAWSNATR